MTAYEAAYREARKVLHERGKNVGLPVRSVDGLRLCPVGEILLLDYDLIKEAFGESFADEILSERVEIGSVPSEAVCGRQFVLLSAKTDERFIPPTPKTASTFPGSLSESE